AFGPRGDARPVHLVRPSAFAVVRGYEPALLPAFFLFRPDRRVRLGGRVGGAGLSGGRELAPDRGRARRGERPGGGGDRGGLRPGRDPAAAGPVGAGVRACALLPISGMSRLSYPRFFFFDLIGVFGWAAGSVALGYLAGESWHLIEDVLGVASGLVVVGIGVGFALVAIRRRRARSVQG